MPVASLVTLWRRLADELGPHVVGATSAMAVGPDQARWVVAGVLARHGGPPQHVGRWISVTNGPNLGVRRIVYEDPSVGAVAADQPFGATLDPSVLFELTWPLPLTTWHGVTGLVTLIQQAATEVWFEDTLDLVTVVGQYTYPLPTLSDWLDSDMRVLRDDQGRPCLYDPGLRTGYPTQLAPWRYDGLNLSGGAATLQLKQAYRASGAVFGLGVIRPAFSRVNGADSSIGPQVGTDTIAADPTEIVAVAKLRAYRWLAAAEHVTDDERAQYAALVDPQEAIVRANVRHYLPRDEAAPAPSGTSAPARPGAGRGA